MKSYIVIGLGRFGQTLARQLAARLGSAELYHILTRLKTAVDHTLSNVSPAAVCGWLTWELR